MKLENVEFIIDGNGEITIGRIGPVSCGATASDEDQCLAMLARRPSESLLELLQRLDGAIEEFVERNVFVDEINE